MPIEEKPGGTADTGATTPASDTATTPAASVIAATSEPADKGKTYTEEEVQRRLGGQGKEIARLNREREELESKLSQLGERVSSLGTLEEQMKTMATELAQAKEQSKADQARLLRFADLKSANGPLGSDVELSWLPESIFELGEDGKPTEAAGKALEQLLKDKPSLARKANSPGMPAIAGFSQGTPRPKTEGQQAFSALLQKAGSK